jgi:hypothetical protein
MVKLDGKRWEKKAQYQLMMEGGTIFSDLNQAGDWLEGEEVWWKKLMGTEDGMRRQSSQILGNGDEVRQRRRKALVKMSVKGQEKRVRCQPMVEGGSREMETLTKEQMRMERKPRRSGEKTGEMRKKKIEA